MFRAIGANLSLVSITKIEDRYIVADQLFDHSLEFTDLQDAKVAAFLVDVGVPINALDEQTVFFFKLELLQRRRSAN